MKYLLFFIAFFQASAQDSTLFRMLNQKKYEFSFSNGTFSGLGWQKIDSASKATKNILIGEDHFFNEIPVFTDAIAKSFRPDNFMIEIDPYTAGILQNKINNLSDRQFAEYQQQMGHMFSFYALEKEMELLKNLAKNKVEIMGTDQILLIGERLICKELSIKTKNKAAKKIYQSIQDSSKVYFGRFLNDQSKPFYFYSDHFENQLEKLLKLPISNDEKTQIEAMKLSKKIYIDQSHFLRLQLMKNNFNTYYQSKLIGKKNLYKFGAVHMPKGEGLLGGYDIGNMVYNMADSRYEKSLHIMIVGKNGEQGSFFAGGSPQKLDPENGELKALKPFFDEVGKINWMLFDLTDMQRQIRRGNLQISDLMLRRILQGYDYLVVIPEVSAGKQ